MNGADVVEGPLSRGLRVLAKVIAADISRAFDESKWLEDRVNEIMKDERFMAALQ